ncbi:hypothetical protein [uncultured Brevundimonas sp.]|uniref:hypothetical protein n=1 Tax=uncultured Brevundimonas sp. TaxID=213418 RepID=UPI0026321F6D|nr:hypothetical protein [uncultured Brevundimonas sp.]
MSVTQMYGAHSLQAEAARKRVPVERRLAGIDLSKPIKVTEAARSANHLKNPPKPISVDLSWVDQLQRESQERFDRFMAQRPGLGISSEFNPTLQWGIRAYETAGSRLK